MLVTTSMKHGNMEDKHVEATKIDKWKYLYMKKV